MHENINPRRKWIIIGWAFGIAVAWAIGGWITGGIGGFIGGIIGGLVGGAIMLVSTRFPNHDEKQLDLFLCIVGWVLGVGIYGALSRLIGEFLGKTFPSGVAWSFGFAVSGIVGGLVGSLSMVILLRDSGNKLDIALNTLIWGISFAFGSVCGAILAPIINLSLFVFGFGIDPLIQGVISLFIGGAIAGGISGFVGENYALRKLFQRSVEGSGGFPLTR